MKNNILIHIGYPKAASTWLQQIFFKSNNKIFTTFSEVTKEKESIARYLYLSSDGYLLSPFDMNVNNIKEKFRSLLSTQFNEKITVISSERLVGNPLSGGFDAPIIAHRLKSIFPEARILIIIREQKSFILSYYFQYLADGGIYSLKKFLNIKYDGTRPFFSPYYLDYLFLVRKYYQLFGKENVLVLPYEMLNTKPRLFVSKLETFLHIKFNFNENHFDTKINKRNDYFLLYFFRLFNLIKKILFIYFPPLFRLFDHPTTLMFHKINHIVPSKFNKRLVSKLNNIIINYTKDRYKKSNTILSSLIHIDLNNFGY